MDGELDQEKIESDTKSLNNSPKSTKGDLKTMPFIIVNEAFEKVASYGLMPNMIFYLMQVYHMEAATGSSILSIWSALSNALAILELLSLILTWVGFMSLLSILSLAFLE